VYLMLPLQDKTTFILGNGADLPIEHLSMLDPYFTLGVNRIHRWYQPDAVCYIDGNLYMENPEFFQETLCFTDSSMKCHPNQIGLGISHSSYASKYLNPNRIYMFPNSGVIAALLAMALGAKPVILLGMGAADDGRLPNQLEAMRAAMSTLKANYEVWQWKEENFEKNIRHHSLREVGDKAEIEKAIRAFYRE